jgi:hypothetical protein
MKPLSIGRFGERDASARLDPAVQAHAQFRQIGHIRLSNKPLPCRMAARA